MLRAFFVAGSVLARQKPGREKAGAVADGCQPPAMRFTPQHLFHWQKCTQEGMVQGFYSAFFLIPKRDGGLRHILNLKGFNRFLKRLPFRMLSLSRLLLSVRHGDWFTTVDLRNAYLHIPIHREHRKGVLAQVSPLWPVTGSPHLYKMYGRGTRSSPAPGCSHSELPGRLADMRPFRAAGRGATQR